MKDLNKVVSPNGLYSLVILLLNVDFSKIYDGERSLYIYGFIEYVEPSYVQDHHVTKFCYLYWHERWNHHPFIHAASRHSRKIH